MSYHARGSPAGVAQLAEQPSCKRQVSGSIPLTGSYLPDVWMPLTCADAQARGHGHVSSRTSGCEDPHKKPTTRAWRAGGGLQSPADARAVLAACWEATGTLSGLLLPELARALRDMEDGHTALAVQFAYRELARISERLRSAGEHLGREGISPLARPVPGRGALGLGAPARDRPWPGLADLGPAGPTGPGSAGWALCRALGCRFERQPSASCLRTSRARRCGPAGLSSQSLRTRRRRARSRTRQELCTDAEGSPWC